MTRAVKANMGRLLTLKWEKKYSGESIAFQIGMFICYISFVNRLYLEITAKVTEKI